MNQKYAVAALLAVMFCVGALFGANMNAVAVSSSRPHVPAAVAKDQNYPPARDLDSAVRATPKTAPCPMVVRLANGKLLHLLADLAILESSNRATQSVGLTCFAARSVARGHIL